MLQRKNDNINNLLQHHHQKSRQRPHYPHSSPSASAKFSLLLLLFNLDNGTILLFIHTSSTLAIAPSPSSSSSPPPKRAQQSPHKYSFHSPTTRSQQGYPHECEVFKRERRSFFYFSYSSSYNEDEATEEISNCAFTEKSISVLVKG